jgi:endo-1,4-beta-xylanase
VTSGSPGLRNVADVPVGVAVDAACLDEPAYVRTLLREFSAVTPENAMKWGPVHPAERVWDFGTSDRIVAFAEAHGLRVHGHTLVWHEQLPAWVAPALSTREAERVLAEHIETPVGRYEGRIGSWDVVNEIMGDGGRLRGTVFLRAFGRDYLAAAFRCAHAADPSARLYYNDYGIEAGGAKSDAAYALVRRLVEDGVPIHGVGLEMHLRAARPPAPAAVRANLARLAALGLEVRISEMDVRIRSVRRGDPLARQRVAYRASIAACIGQPGFAGVTFWGVSDRHSWIHARFGEDAPLLFDREYAPKPAYYGARDALTSANVSAQRLGGRPASTPEHARDRK